VVGLLFCVGIVNKEIGTKPYSFLDDAVVVGIIGGFINLSAVGVVLISVR
jgi:hypothetical protein